MDSPKTQFRLIEYPMQAELIFIAFNNSDWTGTASSDFEPRKRPGPTMLLFHFLLPHNFPSRVESGIVVTAIIVVALFCRIVD